MGGISEISISRLGGRIKGHISRDAVMRLMGSEYVGFPIYISACWAVCCKGLGLIEFNGRPHRYLPLCAEILDVDIQVLKAAIRRAK